MSDELSGRDPRVWYELARGLSWWRDRLSGHRAAWTDDLPS